MTYTIISSNTIFSVEFLNKRPVLSLTAVQVGCSCMVGFDPILSFQVQA